MIAEPRQLQSEAEWLRARRIGGSDVAAILGLSKYRSEWDVYSRLVLGEVDTSTSPDAERGRRLEPRVLRGYTAATGRQVERPGRFALFERDDFATASVDGLAERRRRLVEAKTDRRPERWGEPQVIERWDRWAEQVVRPDYYLQVSHYLWVLDLQVADLAVLVPGEDPFLPELRVYEIHRDEEVVASLVDRLSTWWRVHVVGRREPAWDGSAAASRYLARQERTQTRRATPAEVALAAAYETARRQEREAGEAKRLAGQLLAATGVRRLDLPVGHVTVVTSSGRSTLDERSLLVDRPELAPVLDQYRRDGDPYTYVRISGLGGTE